MFFFFSNANYLRDSIKTNKKIKAMEMAFYQSDKLLVKLRGLSLLLLVEKFVISLSKSHKGSTKSWHLHVLSHMFFNGRRRKEK